MNIALLIIKGIVTGMAVMIPGVSAGSMIMSMGLYEDLMLLISGGKAEKKSTLPRLIPFAGGVAAGVVLFAFIFKFLLTNYPLPTSCLFIGLILGGIPMLWRQVDKKHLTVSNIISFAAAVAVVVVMLIVSLHTNASNSLAPSFGHFFLAIILGFLAAATMIIPGISGSALMLILGYYDELITTLTNMFKGDFINILVFIPFLIGALVGVVLVAKAIRKLLDRFPNSTYMCMVGLMAASPVAVIFKIGQKYGINYGTLGVPVYLISAVLLAVGFFIAYVLSKKEN